MLFHRGREEMLRGSRERARDSRARRAGATHTFTLVAGAGDDDNTELQISGTTLQTAQSLDFEADASLTVRVRADDGSGGTFDACRAGTLVCPPPDRLAGAGSSGI